MWIAQTSKIRVWQTHAHTQAHQKRLKASTVCNKRQQILKVLNWIEIVDDNVMLFYALFHKIGGRFKKNPTWVPRIFDSVTIQLQYNCILKKYIFINKYTFAASLFHCTAHCSISLMKATCGCACLWSLLLVWSTEHKHTRLRASSFQQNSRIHTANDTHFTFQLC